MNKESKTFIVGRDSKTGRFVPAKEVGRHLKTVTIERVSKDTRVPRELRAVVIKSTKRK